jgi:hypothetical protein
VVAIILARHIDTTFLSLGVGGGGGASERRKKESKTRNVSQNDTNDLHYVLLRERRASRLEECGS